MKICTQCKHHEMVYRGVLVPEVVGCDRRKLTDVTDGKKVYRVAAVERGGDQPDNCGPEGKHFEAI